MKFYGMYPRGIRCYGCDKVVTELFKSKRLSNNLNPRCKECVQSLLNRKDGKI